MPAHSISTPPALSAAPSRRELVVSRLLAAPRPRVFQAWIDPDRLAEWWGPHGMSTPVCEIDPQPGGVFRTVLRASDGTEYPSRGVFLEIAAPVRIVYTDAFDPGWKPSGRAFMTAMATFDDHGGKTKCTLRAQHWTEADRATHERMGFYQGWNESFDRLAAFLAASE